jgi:hypothetical protein
MSESLNDRCENTRAYARPPHSADGRRARRTYACEHCGRDFHAKPVHDQRGVSPRRFCSKRCAGAHRTAEKAALNTQSTMSREASVPQRPAKLIDMAQVQPLTPGQSAKVRSYVVGLLRVQIPCAHQVVMGEVDWSPTQARIFTKLLDKCVPDLSASFVESESRNEDFACMTREELEALAADLRSERP